MRIFFSVGEPSGDLHGANLIKRLRSQNDEIEFVGFGGPKMDQAGCTLLYDLTSLAVMFIGEALKNIRFFFKLVDQANDYFANHKVDAVVLIDYPGFNWWIARKAKKHGIPVFYYGVPQMWAWAPWRVRKIRKFVDHVLCKLPFEVDWFAKRNCTASYVGHPYFDQLAHQTYDETFLAEQTSDNGPLITLLPGSRNQEVKNILPILLNAASRISDSVPGCRIAIASFNELQRGFAEEAVEQFRLKNETSKDMNVQIHAGKTPELMKSSRLCLACSGSVSMELLHYRKPTIIVYKVKRWIMAAQAVLLRTKFITLVNLIASKDIRKKTWGPYDPDSDGGPDEERPVMPEYLTTGDPSESVAERAIAWLTDHELYNRNVDQLDCIATKYALPGATVRAADYILEQLGCLESLATTPTMEAKIEPGQAKSEQLNCSPNDHPNQSAA